MIFKVGSFTHEVNDVQLQSHRRQSRYSPRNRRRSRIHTLAIEGRLKIDTSGGDTVADLTNKIQALENSYAHDDVEVGLYLNSGTATAHVLTTADAIDGINILQLNFDQPVGSEYAVSRRFSAVFQAEYLQSDESQITEFKEQVRSVGTTGPSFRVVTRQIGVPISFINALWTTQRVFQTGFSVGYQGWPEGAVPLPLYPLSEHVDRRQIERIGGDSHRHYILDRGMRWSYQFTLANRVDPIPAEG